jgi:hypothetical protein
MSDHYIHVCSCGNVIAQCRCGGDRTRTVIPNGCDDCKGEMKEEYTIEYFSNLLEAMAKGTKERCYRRIRVKPGNPLRPVDSDPIGGVEHNLQRDVDNSPLKTGRGKASVARQAKANQRHPERFAEAVQFIKENIGDDDAIGKLSTISDPLSLKLVAWKMLSKPSQSHREWLEHVTSAL